MQNFGPVEAVIILSIFLLIFGRKKIPELIKGVTEAVKEFKKASR